MARTSLVPSNRLNAPSITTVSADEGAYIGPLLDGARTNDPYLAVSVGLSGTGAVAGDRVQLYDGAGTHDRLGAFHVLTAAEITAGAVDLSTGLLDDGTAYSVTARVVDARGSVSPPSTPFTFYEDRTPPQVMAMTVTTSTGTNTVGVGDTVTIKLDFGETVIVTGPSAPNLRLDGLSSQALFTGGMPGPYNSLTFIYTVQPWDSTPDLRVSLDGAIADDHPFNFYVGNFTADLGIRVDTGPPPIITSNGGGDSASVSVTENTTAVTTVIATDADSGDTATYSLYSGNDWAAFTLDPVTGVLGFAAAPDYERPTDFDGDNVYDVIVQVSDSIGHTDYQTIHVSVTNQPGVTITGTSRGDTIDATHTPPGQPPPTGEDDVIDGRGGRDYLSGLDGNDTYIVDNRQDVVVETVGGGYDAVLSSASYTLAAGVEIEKLVLTGRADLDATGNEFGQEIVGNTGDNRLEGGGGNDLLDGGRGTDRIIGGLGNDTYRVDTAGDVVVERSDQGFDTIVTTASSLTAAANVEALVYVGTRNFDGFANSAGTAITGGSGNDRLWGSSGSDLLSGGAGNDMLRGAGGADTFHFNAPSGMGVDRIADFVSGTDHIELSLTGFDLPGRDFLNFVSGPNPVNTDSRATVLYDTGNGALYFDPTGLDDRDQVRIAVFDGRPALSAGDFLVI